MMNRVERQFSGSSCGKSQNLIFGVVGSLIFIMLAVDSITVIMLPLL